MLAGQKRTTASWSPARVALKLRRFGSLNAEQLFNASYIPSSPAPGLLSTRLHQDTDVDQAIDRTCNSIERKAQGPGSALDLHDGIAFQVREQLKSRKPRTPQRLYSRHMFIVEFCQEHRFLIGILCRFRERPQEFNPLFIVSSGSNESQSIIIRHPVLLQKIRDGEGGSRQAFLLQEEQGNQQTSYAPIPIEKRVNGLEL
jgi:hypothetical protein